MNDELDKVNYIKQSPSFQIQDKPHLVCKLTKSLCNLKHAPIAWFNKFRMSLGDLGFTKLKVDPSMFFHHGDNPLNIVPAYVDDIIIIGSDSSYIIHLIQALKSKLSLKDLDYLHFFFGIEVSRSIDTIHLLQHKYIQDLVKMGGLESLKLLKLL